MTRALSEFRGVLFDADEIILVEPACDHMLTFGGVIHGFLVSFSQGSTLRFGFESFEAAEFGRVLFVDQFCRRK